MTTYLKNDSFPLWKVTMGNLLKKKQSYTLFILAPDAIKACEAALEFEGEEDGYTEVSDTVTGVELITVTIIDCRKLKEDWRNLEPDDTLKS